MTVEPIEIGNVSCSHPQGQWQRKKGKMCASVSRSPIAAWDPLAESVGIQALENYFYNGGDASRAGKPKFINFFRPLLFPVSSFRIPFFQPLTSFPFRREILRFLLAHPLRQKFVAHSPQGNPYKSLNSYVVPCMQACVEPYMIILDSCATSYITLHFVCPIYWRCYSQQEQ